MRPATLVAFLAIDQLLSPRGKPLFGVAGFLADLGERGIPCVWLTERSRNQLDESLRTLGHVAPFVAESGAGVYLPEDYFHLRPEKTIRLGRFTCIPLAEKQSSAKDALEALSQEAGVPVVPLSSLTPRELVQNIGLPQREADLARMRDFSELFFFAGATDPKVQSFLAAAQEKGIAIRRFGSGAIFSLAVGADEGRAIREVSKLYDRALRGRALRVAIAPPVSASRLAGPCDRVIELAPPASSGEPVDGYSNQAQTFVLSDRAVWEQVTDSLTTRTRR